MLRIIFFVLLIPSLCFGANYYVDPTYNGSNGSSNGSYFRPWTNMAGQVNAHSFKTGDRLYFRAGTITIMDAPLRIRWSGTEGSRAVVGAYYGENQFGLGGNPRPVLDGNGNTVPSKGSWSGLIELRDRPGYVTVQDIEIRSSGGYGIDIGNAANVYDHTNKYIIVRNCKVVEPWRDGIVVQRASHNLIENNRVTRSSWGAHVGTRDRGGAGITIIANNDESRAQYNVVRGNVVDWGQEGIGVYQRARHTTIENNIVFDCGTYNIYLDKVRDAVVRDNLVYATANSRRGANRGFGIVACAELWEFQYEAPIGNYVISNNYIAGMYVGIGMYTIQGATMGHKNSRIHDNRLVDNIYNFYFLRDFADWEGINIYQNYSFVFSSVSNHVSKLSPIGVNWNSNHFNTILNTTGKATVDAYFGEKLLEKKAGWRDLQPGKVDKTFFLFSGEYQPTTIPDNETAERPQKVSNFSIQ